MSRRGARGWWAFRPGLETLEGRRVPAQFGVPWHDPEHLSVSFVPDGTPIAGDRSGLFGLLDGTEPTATWQGEILRAFQTWADAARVNFSVVPDDGTPLGAPGPDQGDPRFGDIRIGARPMSPEVLAISVPHDPFLSGTWSGDIFLNSSIAFGKDVRLMPVILHEVGHVLGLDESPDPRSVMFGRLDQAKTTLSPEDVKDVEALYGPRVPDPFEGPGGNDLPQTATPLLEPGGFDGSTPLFLYADITRSTDVDVFSFRPPAGYDGPVTIRVQTAGVSLLAPQFSVLDASGAVIARASSTSLMGDTLQVTLPAVEAGATYRVQVQSAPGEVIGAGKYALAVSFDGRSTIGPDAIDRLARQSYDYLSPVDIEAIFRDPQSALFGVDRHSDDTLATAAKEKSIGAYGSMAPYRLTASLSDQSDVDFYRIETPEEDDSDGPLVMTATVRVTEVNGLASRVSVFDRDGRPVPAVVLAHGAGTYTIQVADARPDSTYFVRVDHDPATAAITGNYELDIEFGNQAAAPVDFAGGTLDARNPRAEFELVVNEAQLFDFLLSGLSALPSSQSALRMTITDLQGRPVATLSTRNGETSGDSLLLFPGHYRVAFELEADGSGLRPPVAFRLYGASLSDPIGPALDDRSLDPGSGALHSDSPPPVVGTPDAPYVWLARTLAARPEPGDASARALGDPGIARSGGAPGALAIAPSSSMDVRLLPGGASPVAAALPVGRDISMRAVAQDLAWSFGRSSPGRRSQDGQGGSFLDHAEVLHDLGDEVGTVAGVALEVPAEWPRSDVIRLRAPAVGSQTPVATEPGAETVHQSAAGAPMAARSPSTAAAIGFGPQAGAVLWAAAAAYFCRHRYADWFARLTRLARWRSGKTSGACLQPARDFFQRLRFSPTWGKRRRGARRGSSIGGLRWRLPTLHGQAHW